MTSFGGGELDDAPPDRSADLPLGAKVLESPPCHSKVIITQGDYSEAIVSCSLMEHEHTKKEHCCSMTTTSQAMSKSLHSKGVRGEANKPVLVTYTWPGEFVAG